MELEPPITGLILGLCILVVRDDIAKIHNEFREMGSKFRSSGEYLLNKLLEAHAIDIELYKQHLHYQKFVLGSILASSIFGAFKDLRITVGLVILLVFYTLFLDWQRNKIKSRLEQSAMHIKTVADQFVIYESKFLQIDFKELELKLDEMLIKAKGHAGSIN